MLVIYTSFLLLTRYVPNVAYMTSVYVYIDNRPQSWKISNSHISVTGHPIHLFGSR